MQNIRNILSQEDTVLFIGSGISLWSGLPSWWQMIEELSAFVEKTGMDSALINAEAKRGDLLQAASYGFDKLSNHQIGEFIRASCRYGTAKPHIIHEKIVNLGPSCFVTTNYDNLIEESIRQWLPDKFFRPPVTNRHLTETAEIVHARSNNFIFKPHGDAGDSDSIILTREQYRKLLPGGERQAALETVKMLLASRPVVYLGFGLRDPDFLYLRDLLANTYKGGTRDHYAIMADVEADESSYWRKNYGIHLISYKTKIDSNDRKDHNELLTLLDELKPKILAESNSDERDQEESFSDKSVLSLARHAGRLARFEKETPELLIRVKLNNTTNGVSTHYHVDKFNNRLIDFVLSEQGPKQAIITGLPGAGKTYSMKRAAALLSEKLNDVCLEEEFNSKNALIPIYIDLKLYQGNLEDLINKSLPSNLDLLDLDDKFRLRLFIDSFNEMPREFWENGSYEKDIARFLDSLKNSSVIIGSRTNDGLSKFDFQNYSLENIDLSHVESELEKSNIVIEGRFKNEIISILRKPFYFNLFASDKVSLSNVRHPHDVYKSFFDNIASLFDDSFNATFNLELALSKIAFDSLNNGNEAQSLHAVMYTLKTQLQLQKVTNLNESELVNWLVSRNVIIPLIHNRVAFFHQSITEYLAATELARQYKEHPEILKEKLIYARWDQALFLALSVLPAEHSSAYFNEVMNMDFALALSASKYVEFERDYIISKLLKEIPIRIAKYGHHDNKLESSFERNVIVNDVHESLLLDIVGCKNSIGGVAIKKLTGIKGPVIKERLFKLLVKEKADYNFLANGLMHAIYPLIDSNDLAQIIALINEVDGEMQVPFDSNNCQGFITAVSGMLSKFDLIEIKNLLVNDKTNELSPLKSEIIFEILRDCSTQEALITASEFLLADARASIPIYFLGKFRGQIDDVDVDYDWSIFNDNHLDKLIEYTKDGDAHWSLGVIKIISSFSRGFANLVEIKAEQEIGVFKSVLLSASLKNSDLIFQELNRICELKPNQVSREPVYLFKNLEIDWRNREELLVKCLRVSDLGFIKAISDDADNSDFGMLDIGPVQFWLDLLKDFKSNEEIYWLGYSLSRLFASKLSKENFQAFVDEFNKPDSNFRDLLSDIIFPAQDGITTDDFTEEAISYLLSNLSKDKSRGFFDGCILSRASTEKFVKEYLLPLSSITEEPMASNLRKILLASGSRHGVRYLSD